MQPFWGLVGSGGFFKRFRSYIGYRAGISSSGDWIVYVADD
jgi:hypothetical protein